MRLIDVARNIDKSEKNESYVDLEQLHRELDLPVYGYAEQDRLKAYWVEKWLCTDACVGGRMYFFDGEPVAYSFQQGRKFQEDFAWFSKEAAEKVRDFVESLSKRELQVNVVDMNENLGDSYKIEFASQVLDWSKARYHGEPIEFVRVFHPTEKPSFCDDERVMIRRPGSEWSFEVDMEELDFLFQVHDLQEKVVGGGLDEAELRPMIPVMKRLGITLEQVSEELNYREHACVTDGHAGWDDQLIEYSTAELEFIEQVWNEMAEQKDVGVNELDALGVDCSKVHIFRLDQVESGGYLDGIKYWSNTVGELQDPSGCDIREDELPDGLRHAYTEIDPFEMFGSRCRLVETENGYGIALENEYDEGFAEDIHVSMRELFLYAAKDAEKIANDPLFENAEIFLEERAGEGYSHELIVVVPADIKPEEFKEIALRVDLVAYQTAYQVRDGVLDDLIQSAEDKKDNQKGEDRVQDLQER